MDPDSCCTPDDRGVAFDYSAPTTQDAIAHFEGLALAIRDEYARAGSQLADECERQAERADRLQAECDQIRADLDRVRGTLAAQVAEGIRYQEWRADYYEHRTALYEKSLGLLVLPILVRRGLLAALARLRGNRGRLQVPTEAPRPAVDEREEYGSIAPSDTEPAQASEIGQVREQDALTSLEPTKLLWESSAGTLVVPSDHALPRTLERYPEYSQNLPRLVRYTQSKYPALRVIDVGANVGDTARFIRGMADVPILCVEGSEVYNEYLRLNVSGFRDICVVETFVGDDSSDVFGLRSSAGTGRLEVAHSQQGVITRQLDDVLAANPEFASAKVLKTDTDGFELRVLKGADKWIRESSPIVFLEYDPLYLERYGDSGVDLVRTLANLGYKNALVYDAYGYLMFGVPLEGHRVFEGLDQYLRHKGGLPYVDLAVFHEDDTDIYLGFESEERQYYLENCQWSGVE